jgi:hypothetical protein
MIYVEHLHTFDEYQDFYKETNKYKIEKVTRAEVLDRTLLFLYYNPGDVIITIEDKQLLLLKDRGDVIDAVTGEIMCIYDEEYYRIQTCDWLLEEYNDDYCLNYGFMKITRN